MQCRQEHEDHGGGGNGHDHHDHSHGHSHDHDLDDPDGFSLFGLIDTTKVRCLNESFPNSGLHPLKPYDQRTTTEPYLESNEDDPELILYIPFTQVVKMRSICVVGGTGGTAPEHVKIWINRDDIDFSNANDLPSVQGFDLFEENLGAAMDYPLVPRKFQNVSSLVLFFSSNYGADSTIISYIGLKGENTHVRHGVVEAVYESRPQAEDHKSPAGEYTTRSIL